jgi:hypothetical protein
MWSPFEPPSGCKVVSLETVHFPQAKNVSLRSGFRDAGEPPTPFECLLFEAIIVHFVLRWPEKATQQTVREPKIYLG